jgi:hypothetical protein
MLDNYNLLFIVKKVVVCSPLVRRQRLGAGGGGRGVDVATEVSSRQKGGCGGHRFAAAKPPPSSGLMSGATDDTQGRDTT